MNLNELVDDIAAFADDDEDVAVDPDGSILFVRNGQETECQLVVGEDGRNLIRIDGTFVPYRDFVTRHLGKLDVLAERLLEKRPRVDPFIDGPARVERTSGDPRTGPALSLLEEECLNPSPFATRLAFITADAGHGKTALLREFQARRAEAFLKGRASAVFWHVDLQGRQLLRLSEALMGDLGDLRITGLWMAGIIRLLRHHGLILAIDGFDELAAEQGAADAIGALATLVDQLEGAGIIVAASRRTFFDTEDYLRRAGVFRRAMANPCQFDQVSLEPWTEIEAVSFLSRVRAGDVTLDDPRGTYEELTAELGGNASHPIVTRPFLLTQVAKALLTYGTSAAAFLRLADDPHKGVATVVEGFVRREVQEKWRYKTGEPYLTVDQHMQLLADVAEEMYRSQKDRLSIEIIETIATLLLDAWNVDPSRRQQVIEMVKMHVLLVVPADGDGRSRSFDHPEFRDYFIAVALKAHLAAVMGGGTSEELGRFVSIAQLSDSTAKYVCGMLPLNDSSAKTLLEGLKRCLRDEWRPTFLQTNVGTLFPYIVDGIRFAEKCDFNEAAVYSSVVFEDSHLSNVSIARGSFVNASFRRVKWQNVAFRDCELGELSMDSESRFSNVTFENCHLSGIRMFENDRETSREYSPQRMHWQLEKLGILVDGPPPDGGDNDIDVFEGSPFYRFVHRALRLFHRSTILPEHVIVTKFRQDNGIVLNEVMPLLETYEIVEERPWRGSGTQRLWVIRKRIDEVFAAEGGDDQTSLGAFWRDVRSRK